MPAIQNDSGTVFNDGGVLVIDSTACVLPSVCLKTGGQTKNRFHLEDQFLSRSSRVWACVLGGAIGYAIAKKIWGQPIALELPLSKEWAEEASQKLRSGFIAVIIGVVFLLICLMLTFYHGVFAVLGLFGVIAALVIAYLKDQQRVSPFSVSNIQHNWIWINGVNPEVAARFPLLPREGPPDSVHVLRRDNAD